MTPAAGTGVRVFADIAGLSAAAAGFVLESARNAGGNGRFSIALSGGSTPRLLYELLSRSPWKEDMPWRQTHCFWADERLVPPGHADSNYRMAADLLLSRVPVPAGNIHRVRAEAGSGAAAEYENQLLQFFSGPPRFDLAILGAGPDGHTASLFPGSAALDERRALALAVHREDHDRVTLTLPVLNSAGRVLFLVSGAAKAGIVREILGDGNPRQLPAGLVRPERGTVTWMLDREAAEKLQSKQ